MKTTRLVIVLVLVLSALAAVGQAENSRSGSVSGRIVTAADGLPAAGFWVEIEELGVGVLTDTLGQFTFENLKPGVYHLSVTGVGEGTFRDLPGQEVKAEVPITNLHRDEMLADADL